LHATSAEDAVDQNEDRKTGVISTCQRYQILQQILAKCYSEKIQ